MRYAFGVALLLLAVQLPASSVQGSAHQVPVTESGSQVQATSHDLAISYVMLVGPPAISISDTNGRYMWVISALRNNSQHADVAQFNITFAGALPAGCQREGALILPGQTSMLVPPGEQKMLIWRARFECHSPATLQVMRETVTVAVTHCDPATSEPGPITQPTPGGVCPENSQTEGPETNLANNTATASKQILMQ